MRYICDLITADRTANNNDTCKAGLPSTLPPPPPVIGSLGPVRIGTAISLVTPRDRIGLPDRGRGGSAGTGAGGGSAPVKAYADIIAGYNPAVHTISLVEPALANLCVPQSELRKGGETTKALIQVFQLATNRPVTGKLQPTDIAQINNLRGCPAGRLNYYEAYVMTSALNSKENTDVYKDRGFADLEGATVDKVRSRIPDMRQTFSGRLKLNSPALSRQMTPDLMAELSRPRLQ
jgi:hypothetical protein